MIYRNAVQVQPRQSAVRKLKLVVQLVVCFGETGGWQGSAAHFSRKHRSHLLGPDSCWRRHRGLGLAGVLVQHPPRAVGSLPLLPQPRWLPVSSTWLCRASVRLRSLRFNQVLESMENFTVLGHSACSGIQDPENGKH